MTRTFLLAAAAATLCGCASKFTVVDSETGHVGQGWMTSPQQEIVINTGKRAYYGRYNWEPGGDGTKHRLFIYGEARDDHTINCNAVVDEQFKGEGECRATDGRYKVIFDR